MSWWESSSVFLGGNRALVTEGLSFFLACLHLLNVKGIEVWRSHSASCHPAKTALRIIYYIVQAIELCSKTGLLRKAKREARKNKTEKWKGCQSLRLRNQAYFVSCCSEISDLEMQSFGTFVLALRSFFQNSLLWRFRVEFNCRF